MEDSNKKKSDFERSEAERPPTLLGEIIEFIVIYRKWWLIPIVLSLGFVGLLAALAATGAAPFIYSLF